MQSTARDPLDLQTAQGTCASPWTLELSGCEPERIDETGPRLWDAGTCGTRDRFIYVEVTIFIQEVRYWNFSSPAHPLSGRSLSFLSCSLSFFYGDDLVLVSHRRRSFLSSNVHWGPKPPSLIFSPPYLTTTIHNNLPQWSITPSSSP